MKNLFPRVFEGLLFSICIFAFNPGTAFASEAAAATYNQGNEFYAQGSFEKALQAYQQVLAAGVHNADLYYNLGNAYLKTGKKGPAILCYKRALRLRPRDLDIQYNLEYARVLIKGKLPDAQESVLARLAQAVLKNVSLDELTKILSLSYLLVCIGVIILILRPPALLRRISLYLAVLGAAGILCASPFFLTKLYREAIRETGIIMEEKVSAYSGPGEDNARLFDLYEGMEVMMKQSEHGWTRVVLKNGLSGWIPGESLQAIQSKVSKILQN
jgi:tetratricopeptide (TPR) repeat protein